jgi:hypothetical protein
MTRVEGNKMDVVSKTNGQTELNALRMDIITSQNDRYAVQPQCLDIFKRKP